MKRYRVKVNGKVYEVELESVEEQAQKKETKVDTGTTITAPMQGKILVLKVNTGDLIKRGDVVAVLEAMKLENEIVSPVSGKVLSVVVKQDQMVNASDPLMVIGE